MKRALYRWQIHCNLFGTSPAGEHPEDDNDDDDAFYVPYGRTGEDEAALFLLSFRPWEIEEIASLVNYSFEWYRKLIIGKGFCKDLIPSYEFNGVMKNAMRPRTASNDSLIRSCCNHFLSLGPSFFYEVLTTSNPDEQRALLIQNADEYELEDLELLLAWPSQTNHFASPGPEDQDLELQGLQFRGDGSQTSPNAGWVLVYGPASQHEHGDEKNKKLRMLGYVIWDQERLQRWHV